MAGSDTVVSESNVPDSGDGQIGFSGSSLVRSGSGALIAWTTVVNSSSTPIFWGTRALNIDGTPRSAIVSHSPMPVAHAGDMAFMGLAVTPQCGFGGLAYAGGTSGSGCKQPPNNGGTGNLVTVGSNGSLRLQEPLGTFPGFNPRRLVLDDESFLVTTFSETDAANDYIWKSRTTMHGASRSLRE